MTLTVAYVRVSTEDQVDYSPDAQAKRCRAYARQHDLGAVTVMADEGWSGKNLDRPHMTKLLELIEAGQVDHVVTWRLDRLSRDSADLSRLIKTMERNCVTLHSVNEGTVDIGTASGRMQVGVHGVFAQFFRESVIENVSMGMRQAVEAGRWINRAPTGYDMVNGDLVPNELAPIVARIFDLRIAGNSYAFIEAEVGIKYSTVRHILGNRVYRGEVRLKDEWFPGIHPPIVSAEDWDTAQRANTTGRRIGKDLLAGRVRCGLCGRVATVGYNDRNQAIYRCKHRGGGCSISGRSAKGLHRAALLGLRELRDDKTLQAAIRTELGNHRQPTDTPAPDRASALRVLTNKRRKLFDLYYADKITPDAFSVEEQRLTAQVQALEAEQLATTEEQHRRDELADRFEQVAMLLDDLDLDAIWNAATPAERRILIEDLIEAVYLHPGHLEVAPTGSPPLRINLDEVGLTGGTGSRSVVSEGGLAPSATGHWRISSP